MCDNAKSDVESRELEGVAASGVDAEIPLRSRPAMLGSRQLGETEDSEIPSG